MVLFLQCKRPTSPSRTYSCITIQPPREEVCQFGYFGQLDNLSRGIFQPDIAILQYLAEKTGKLLPDSLIARARVYEWMNFHAVDIGSVLFSAFYLEKRITPPQPEAAEILRKRIHELYRYFDQQLARQDFLAGSNYSIADVTVLPAIIGSKQELADYQHLIRWLQQLQDRPAVKRGMKVPKRR